MSSLGTDKCHGLRGALLKLERSPHWNAAISPHLQIKFFDRVTGRSEPYLIDIRIVVIVCDWQESGIYHLLDRSALKKVSLDQPEHICSLKRACLTCLQAFKSWLKKSKSPTSHRIICHALRLKQKSAHDSRVCSAATRWTSKHAATFPGETYKWAPDPGAPRTSPRDSLSESEVFVIVDDDWVGEVRHCKLGQ